MRNRHVNYFNLCGNVAFLFSVESSFLQRKMAAVLKGITGPGGIISVTIPT